MPVNTTRVVGEIRLPQDTVPENSVVHFKITGFDTDVVDNVVIAPRRPQTAQIQSDGTIDINLWPNDDGTRSTLYNVELEIYNGNSPYLVPLGQIEVPQAAGPHDLTDLLPVQPPADTPLEEYLAQLQAAISSTETAAVRAETARDTAQGYRNDAEGFKNTANSAASAANGSASVAAQAAADAAASASSIDQSSYLTTSGDQAKWGKLSLGKEDNDGNLTLLRNHLGVPYARWSFTVHQPSSTLHVSTGDGPDAGGITAARFDPAGEAAGNAQTVITREKGDARYAASRGEIIVEDRKGATEGGQALTASTWVRRDLNTVVLNTISGASLANDEVTLPAGTYDVQAFVPSIVVNTSVTRLYDVTNSAILLQGSVANSHSSFYTSVTSVIMGRFSLSGTAQVGIDHYVQTSAAGGGGPIGIGAGNYSVFTRMQITKVA